MKRLGHLRRCISDGAAMVELRAEHPLLHLSGKHGEKRQHQQQNQHQTGVFDRDDRKNRDDAAGVRCHADDTGGKKRLHSVDIAGKARGNLAGVLPCQRACRKARQLLRHLGAQRMGHFLPEQHKKALLRGGKQPFQREAAEIKKHCESSQRQTICQPVDDARQQQRRKQRRADRRCHAQKRSHREKPVRRCCRPNGGEDAAVMAAFHVQSLLSGFHRACDTPERSGEVPRACRRQFCRLP